MVWWCVFAWERAEELVLYFYRHQLNLYDLNLLGCMIIGGLIKQISMESPRILRDVLLSHIIISYNILLLCFLNLVLTMFIYCP